MTYFEESEPAKKKMLDDLVVLWQNEAIADLNARYGSGQSAYTTTSYTIGAKFAHLVIGTSSAFLVDLKTGTIYGNKGWLKVDYKKVIGNAYDPTFKPAVLLRDRFRYGHFENNADGSLRQEIVRR